MYCSIFPGLQGDTALHSSPKLATFSMGVPQEESSSNFTVNTVRIRVSRV